jgi:hypothetical protein
MIQNYSDCWPLFKTQNEWTIDKYIMEVVRPFSYRTLLMLQRHMVIFNQIIRESSEMFDNMDGVIRAFHKKQNQWKEDLLFAVRLE